VRNWRETLDFLTDCAKRNLERDGYLAPVLLVEVEGGDSALVGINGFGPTVEQRAALLFALGRQLVALRPRRATLVTDAYVKAGDELPEGSLADDPAATECLCVCSMDRHGRLRVLTVTYDRTPTLEGTLIEFTGEHLSDEGEPFLLLAFWAGAGVRL